MTHARPLFNQLNIVSGDPAASLAFYRRLGVEIPEERVWNTTSGTHHISSLPGSAVEADFEIDSTRFASVWNAGWRDRADLAGRVVVGFRVASREEVDRIYRDMTGAGHVGLQEPHDAFWGARHAIIEDPDGIAVGLMSPISDDKRSAPPDV